METFVRKLKVSKKAHCPDNPIRFCMKRANLFGGVCMCKTIFILGYLSEVRYPI